MKIPILLVLFFSSAGCAAVGTAPGGHGSSALTIAHTPTAADSPAIASPSQDQNMAPRIVIPVTGGIPVIGIPLGGDLFLPVTGGAPVIGIPTIP